MIPVTKTVEVAIIASLTTQNNREGRKTTGRRKVTTPECWYKKLRHYGPINFSKTKGIVEPI